MITRPFDFTSRLRTPGNAIDLLPFIDACLILFGFILLSSKFVLAPGISVALPRIAGDAPDLVPASRVLSVSEAEGGREMLIFDGKVFRLASLADYLADGRRAEPNEALLVKFDQSVSAELMAQVFDVAANAGFPRVQLAVQTERSNSAD